MSEDELLDQVLKKKIPKQITQKQKDARIANLNAGRQARLLSIAKKKAQGTNEIKIYDSDSDSDNSESDELEIITKHKKKSSSKNAKNNKLLERLALLEKKLAKSKRHKKLVVQVANNHEPSSYSKPLISVNAHVENDDEKYRRMGIIKL